MRLCLGILNLLIWWGIQLLHYILDPILNTCNSILNTRKMGTDSLNVSANIDIDFIFWQLYLFLILNSKIIKSNLFNSHLMCWRVFSQLIISGLCIEKLWVFPLIPDWSNRRKIRKFDVVWRNWMIREHWFEFIGRIETEVEVVRENCPISKFETG